MTLIRGDCLSVLLLCESLLLRTLCRPPRGATQPAPDRCGSGTTGVACVYEEFDFVGIDRDDTGEYLPVAEARLAHAASVPIQGALLL